MTETSSNAPSSPDRRFLWMLAAGFGVLALSAAGRVISLGKAPPADPPQISPMSAIWMILQRLVDRMYADRMLSVAAGATFYGLLALFPGITALVSLYGLIADPNTVVNHVSTLSGLLPSSGIDLISEQVKRIAGKGTGTLSAAFFTSLVVSLWSAMAGMKSIFEALNVAESRPEQRSFWTVNLLALTFTLGSIAFVIIAISAIVLIPAVLDYIGFVGPSEHALRLLRWPLLLLAIIIYVATLYRYGPCRSGFRWRWVTLGSAVAGSLWFAASLLFSLYVGSLGNYNEVYGSLGAVVAFMTWMWLSISIIILGAVLNSELTILVPRLEAASRRQPGSPARG